MMIRRNLLRLLGALGVVAASILLLLYTPLISTKFSVVAENALNKLDKKLAEFSIKTDGVEALLSQIALEASVPMVVDENTTLVKLEAEGAELRYIYAVSNEIQELNDSMESDIVTFACTNAFFRPILKAGTSINHIYFNQDEILIGSYNVLKQKCAEFVPV